MVAQLSFVDHEHHALSDKLLTEVSKMSQPMKWNQPPKKSVLSTCASDMVFVKPSHGRVERMCTSHGTLLILTVLLIIS